MASRESVTHMPALIDGVMFQAVFRFRQSLDVIQICDAEPFCPAMDAAILRRLRPSRQQIVRPARAARVQCWPAGAFFMSIWVCGCRH
jgi:hypothetical protein